MATQRYAYVDPGGGGDYLTLAAALTDHGSLGDITSYDLLNNDEVANFVCSSSDGSKDTSNPTIDNSWTGDATRYVNITQSDFPADGIFNAGGGSGDPYVLSPTSGNILTLAGSPNFKIDKLQIESRSTSGTVYGVYANTTCTGTINRLWIKRTDGGTNSHYLVSTSANSGGDLTFTNCIMKNTYGGTGYCFYGRDMTIKHCIAYLSALGYRASASNTITIINSAAGLCDYASGDFYGTFTSVSYCCADDTDEGTNMQQPYNGAGNWSNEYTDAANDDFSPPSDTNNNLYNNGTSAGVSEDIIGTARPQGASVDIGAFEYPTGGALAEEFHLVATGSGIGFSQDSLTSGFLHNYTINIKEVTSGGIQLKYGSTVIDTHTTVGEKTGSFTPDSTTFSIVSNGACNLVFDDVFICRMHGTLEVSASDGLALTDSPAKNKTTNAAAADGLAANDGPNKIAGLYRLAADGIRLADTPLNSFITNKLAIDGVRFSELITADLILPGTIEALAADGIIFSDSASAVFIAIALAADGLIATDSPSTIATINAAVEDAATFSELLTGGSIFVSVADDGLVFNDIAVGDIAINALVAEGIVLSDSASRALNAFVASVDEVKLSDDGTVLANFSVIAEDTAQLSEVLSLIATLGVTVGDGIKFSDASASALDSERAVGLVTATITLKKTTLTFTVKKPNAGFTVKKPETTIIQ